MRRRRARYARAASAEAPAQITLVVHHGARLERAALRGNNNISKRGREPR